MYSWSENMFSDFKFCYSVWFAVLSLVHLELYVRVGSAPICAYGQTGCHVPSLADLFDRVIQQSSRMHGISSDLHSEFVSPFFLAWHLSSITIHHPSSTTDMIRLSSMQEQYSFPSKNLIGKRKCHTHGIQTPDDKENVQRLGVSIQFVNITYSCVYTYTFHTYNKCLTGLRQKHFFSSVS